MPSRVRACVKAIDDARDRVRADDFFKDVDAEALISALVRSDPAGMTTPLQTLASAFIRRNQAVINQGAKAGIRLGRAFYEQRG